MQKIKFRFSDAHVDSYHAPGVLSLLFLDLTNRCNLRCRYCFNGHNLAMPPRDLELPLLEGILRSRSALTVKNWFFSGGEPLCHPHLDDVLRLFRDHGVRPKIATNGVLLTPAVIDTWVSLGVQSVQFSFDSLRPSVMGSLAAGSPKNHRAVLDNLSHAVASPLRVVASSVLTRANAGEIAEIMRACHGLGIDSYTLYPAVPARKGCEDLVLPPAERMALFDRLFALYRELCPTRIVDLSIPCFERSEVYAVWKDSLAIRLHSCGAGRYNLKVTSAGRVSVCICQDAAEFIVGDLHERSLDEIWSSAEVEAFRSLPLRIPECAACPERDRCCGGCRNEASVLGSRGILSPDPHCEYFASTPQCPPS